MLWATGMEEHSLLTDPLMQRFKVTTERTQVSSLMAVSTCAAFDWQVFSAIERVVEYLLSSYRLQVECVIWVQYNQASVREHLV